MTLPNNNQTKLVKGESKLEFMIVWYVINAVHAACTHTLPTVCRLRPPMLQQAVREDGSSSETSAADRKGCRFNPIN